MHKYCFRIRLTTEIERFLALLEIIVEIVNENLLWRINTRLVRGVYTKSRLKMVENAPSIILCFTVNIKSRIIDKVYIT